MHKKLTPVLLVFLTVSLACSLVTNLVPGWPTSEASLPSSASADGFSAKANADGNVFLQWEPINGAEKYLIEVQIGGEFVSLATVPASQASYEDLNVPPATRFTYRLSSLVKSERGKSKEITLETPQPASNPLQVHIEFDQTPAKFDPQNIDPSSIDPDTVDPNNFDPSAYMPQPVQTEAVVGPQGGELSVTGSNGVVYTLSVPPDALRFDMTITLRPISAIPDLPLSGGLMAAVLVEPDSLVFDIPATLKMTPPAGFPAAAEPLVMAFASESDGQEFHLYPLDVEGGQSRLGGHLASLRAGANFAGPLADALKAQDGGVYGQGSGTVEDVKEIRKKSASKSQDRATQRRAVKQLEELTPLTPIEEGLTPLQPPAALDFGKEGEAILQQVDKADDLSKLMDALDIYSEFLRVGGDKYEYNKKLNDKILDLLVDKAKKLLDKNKGGCLTKDDFKAHELIERLINPKTDFSKALAERFKQKHGQQALDDLAKTRITCSFELAMNSTLTFTAEGSTLHAVANVPENIASPMKLFPTYSKGEIYFSGEGDLKQNFEVTGICRFPLKHYDSLKFFVGKLTPLFDKDGVITDFNLSEYAVRGWTHDVNIAASGNGEKCPSMVKLQGGGDSWTGLFMAARFNKNQKISGWDMQTNLTADNSFHSLQANWVSVQTAFVPFGVAGTTSTENTIFMLTVTKNSR